MKTSKPFATISYNTDDFLISKLGDLVRSHKIDFYCFINHFPEDDELKAHKHLYIVPNGLCDTTALLDYLLEVDPKNPLPLRCLAFKSSKFFDWVMYSLHDKRYLASIGQSRRFNYTVDDLISSDKDYLQEELHMMDYSKLNRFTSLIEAVDANIPFAQLVRLGQMPIQQVYAYEKVYNLLKDGNTERNGHITHTPNIDIETGEILEPKEPPEKQ